MRETILSVGIDIGTTTTQLIFSKITIENTASMRSVPQIRIIDKKVIFTSDIHFTPLISSSVIDGAKIRKIIEDEYLKACINPVDVDTGAVIITGETARKENACEVVKTLSGLAGEFVVATSGPALEGIIAGKGTKADRISKERGCVVANLDIGGGTTNIAIFKNGEVIDTACLDIGGRLIKFEENTLVVSYVSKKLQIFARRIGMEIYVGKQMSLVEVKKIALSMTEILEEVMGLNTVSHQFEQLITDNDLRRDYKIDLISFSGGVADCIYTSEEIKLFQYDDLGVILGRMIRDSHLFKEVEVLIPDETIRATVVGAGSHTTDISGSTITVSEKVLPLKNIPILKLNELDEMLPLDELCTIIEKKLTWFNLEDADQLVALAFKGCKNYRFKELQELSKCIIKGMKDKLSLDAPLVVIIERDMAKALGQALKVHLEFKKDVVCIDSIKVENGDYIDIGKPLANGTVVPVVVKTLLFSY